MKAPVLTKFGFRIRTRLGMTVENLLIPGGDQEAAMRRLQQMYPGCEILECVRHDPTGARAPIVNFEEVAGMITAR